MRHFVLQTLIALIIGTGAQAGEGDVFDVKDALEHDAAIQGASVRGPTVRPCPTPSLPRAALPSPPGVASSRTRTRQVIRRSVMDLWTEPMSIYSDQSLQSDPPRSANGPRAQSTVFVGAADPRPLRFGWSSEISGGDTGDAEDDGSWSLMLESLKAVAPTAEDRNILKKCFADYRADCRRLESLLRGDTSRESDSPDTDDSPRFLVAPRGFLEQELRVESEPSAPVHQMERLAQKLARELTKEHEKVFASIRPEVRLYSIYTRRDFPTEGFASRDSQEFLQEYLRRRAPRAATRALLTTARDLPIVEECYRELIAFRNKYCNVTLSYGGYGKDRDRDTAKESVEELTDRNGSSPEKPGEAISEELARRRLRTEEQSFNPFRKGRVTLTAAPLDFGDWIVLVWKTPNLKVRAGMKQMRVQFGGRIGGLDFSSYATTRFKGMQGRSGVEVVRQLGTSTRFCLSAGVNFGHRDDRDTDFVDVASITSDRSYLLFSWEREF
jgi:hypothetical protein